ncbi:MAG: AAA family ATPase [Enhydrobacter sp.]|nr:MAG: AAA family ATPase [Enhydrobacter sp.]
MLDPDSVPRPMTAPELLQVRAMPAKTLLPPLLGTQTLALLHGPRGLGKSWFAMALARAVAAGEPILGWTPPQPCPVLYFDGEMTGNDMKTRLASLGPPPPLLQFLVAELSSVALPDFAYRDGQQILWAMLSRLRPPALLVFDSLASLTSFSTNDPDRWTELQLFLLRLRRIGFAVLLIHHSNRKGFQRGTNRREDLLDVVIGLRRPSGHRARDGAHFILEVEKARSVHGTALDPIEARLVRGADGTMTWDWRTAARGNLERFAGLLKLGLGVGQAARELGLPRSTAYRMRETAMEAGLLGDAKSAAPDG